MASVSGHAEVAVCFVRGENYRDNRPITHDFPSQ